jgi:hypothetical protein
LFKTKKSISYLVGSALIVVMTAAFACGTEQICWRQLSAVKGVTGNLPLPAGNSGQAATQVVDIDKDGINDFVIASWDSAEAVAWYRRQANGWTKYIIDTQATNIEAGGTFYDIDNDGDLDLIFGDSWLGNHIYWWENPYPNFDPAKLWTRHIIKDSGTSTHHDMMFGDFDGDGQIEFISWNSGTTLLMSKIPANPRTSDTWPLQTIYSTGGVQREGLAAADINLDGKLEIIGGGIWLEHTGGMNFTPHIIDDTIRISRCATGHLISGSVYQQVVFCPGDADGPAKWYDWNGSSWQGHTLVANVIHGHSLALADINGDGNLDVFIGEMAKWRDNVVDNPNAKVRVLYGDGVGNFTEQVVMTGQGVHESMIADLDGDGYLDILCKPFTHNIPQLDVWLSGNGVIGDLSHNCKVTAYDLDLLISQWLSADCDAPLWCQGADINHDTVVNWSDYDWLAQQWLK